MKNLLIAGFLSSLCYSLTYPVIHSLVMAQIDSRLLSFKSLFSCVCVVVIANLWLKHKDKLYKFFNEFLILETVCYSILTMLIIGNKISLVAYFLLDSFIFATITRNIICGGANLKQQILHDNRAEFDNKIDILCNLASVIGYGVGSLFVLDLNLALIIMCVGISIDNLFYGIEYKKSKKIGA